MILKFHLSMLLSQLMKSGSFPNPANEILKIETATAEINISYQFYAPDGKLILSGTTVQGGIDLSQLKKGVYIIHLMTDKEYLSRKIIKH